MPNMSRVTRTYLDIKFNWIRSANEIIEDTLAHRLKKIDEEYERAIRAMGEDADEDELHDLGDFYGDRAYEVTDVIPRVMRGSLFTAAYSTFETFLVSLARHHEKHGPGITLADIRGQGILAARTYLAKVAGIPFPNHLPEWGELQQYRLLRNVITHADGNVEQKEQRKQLQAFAHQVGTFDLDDIGRITLHEKFTTTFLDTAATFADALIEAAKAE